MPNRILQIVLNIYAKHPTADWKDMKFLQDWVYNKASQQEFNYYYKVTEALAK